MSDAAVASAVSACAQPRSARIALATASTLACVRPTANTSSPSRANRRHNAPPRPATAPTPSTNAPRAMVTSPPLPGLAIRAQLDLERPRVARLLMQHPVGLADRRRVHQRIGRELRGIAPRLPDPVAHPRRVHPRVDHEMRDVDVL